MKHQDLQRAFREKILQISFNVKSGHISCSLSCIDILIAILIYSKLKNEEFILSKGHAASALYVCLNYLGVISDKTLESFYQNGTALSAHPAPNKFKEIPFATGSLGHGLPLAVGVALSNKLLNKDLRTFVLLSDGETNEGTTWESAHFAVIKELENLIVIIDNNGLQGFGSTSEVLGETASLDKFEQIGFAVYECDGHNIQGLLSVIEKAEKSRNKKPILIVANTIKGKGVRFMENKLEWHYLNLDETLLEESIDEVQNYIF